MIVDNASYRPGRRVHVVQGEYHVTSDPDVIMTTVLGSCVAVCLRDNTTRVGGMNHFLLPDGKVEGTDQGRRFGAYAMELLINDLLRNGARRERLEAKLFGGARMFDGLSDVGAANVAFAEKFLRDEGIPVLGSSLGGTEARRVQYWPTTGRAQQRTVTDNNELVRLDERPRRPIAPVEDEGALELF
jgi:chemotaxis protein CheD